MWLFSALSVDNRGLISSKIGVISNPLKLQCTVPFIVIVQSATVLFVFILNTALLSACDFWTSGCGKSLHFDLDVIKNRGFIQNEDIVQYPSTNRKKLQLHYGAPLSRFLSNDLPTILQSPRTLSAYRTGAPADPSFESGLWW
jgi:hypothetical protein